jgi:two-component system sensor histidine kinase/response regulator
VVPDLARLVPPSVRGELLSGSRIRLAFFATTASLVAVLSLMMVLSIDRVFDWLTPIAYQELRLKTERGLVDLGRAADIGVLLHDPSLIREATRSYESDPDVRWIVLEDASGETVYVHDKGGGERVTFAGAPDTLLERQNLLHMWSKIKVEGQVVGRIGLAVSTDRLRAGAELRSEVLWSALGVGLLASLMSFLFVRAYVTPLLSLITRAFLDLEQRTHDALDATHTKSRFLANVSHELRTPLNGIAGMTALLLRGSLAAQQRRQAEMVATASKSLLLLINDLLDFSAVEAGRMRLHTADCDLRVLVQGRVELLAIGARGKDLEIGYRISPRVPRLVRVDPDRLEQVLTNIVGNAIKFTPAGEVQLTLDVMEPSSNAPSSPFDAARIMLRFEVRDTGPGIPLEAQADLFQAFSQIDSSASRRFEGTGLGLAISKHLLGLMGGEIGLSSEASGGSTFWFTVEAEVVEAAQPPVRIAGASTARALFVDPNPMYRQLLRQWLEDWGVASDDVASFDEARRLLEGEEPERPAYTMALIDARLMREGAADTLPPEFARAQARGMRVAWLAPAWYTPSRDALSLTEVVLSKPVRPPELLAFVDGSGPLRTVHTPRPPRGPWTRTVLIVEDNEVSRLFAEEVVRDLGCICELAASGREALEKSACQSFDLVLMDCQMPGMSGYETTRQLRAAEESSGRRTPIVALTAHALPEESERVRDSGMDGLLTKPVSPLELEDLLQRFLGPMPEQHDAPAILADQRRSPRVVAMFLQTVPAQLDAMHQASEREDVSELGRLAHRLRGSTGSIGALRLGALCSRLETACEQRETALIYPLVQEILQVFPVLREQLLAERAAE